jgi:ABC-type transport system involved in multi-copper enzyme maturation permease subunit
MHIPTLIAYTVEDCKNSRFFSISIPCTIILFLCGIFIPRWTFGSPDKIIVDFAFSVYQVFSVLLSCAYAIPFVKRQQEYNTLYTFLCAGVSRSTFISGTYLGLLIITFTGALSAYIISLLLVYYETNRWLFSLFPAFCMLAMQSTVWLSWALLCSELFSHTLVATVIFFVLYFSSHLINGWLLFVQQQCIGITYFIGICLYYCIPDATLLDCRHAVTYGLAYNYVQLLIQGIYALLWSHCMITVTKLVFVHKKSI